MGVTLSSFTVVVAEFMALYMAIYKYYQPILEGYALSCTRSEDSLSQNYL
jgi:hypothetical protein